MQCPEYIKGHISSPGGTRHIFSSTKDWGWRLSPTTQDSPVCLQQNLPPHPCFAFLNTPCKSLPGQYRGVIYPKAEGNARNVSPRLQLCRVPQQRMCPISCRTVVFFLIHSSESRKITVFSVLFPFSLVHLSGDLAESFQKINLRLRKRQRSTCWMHVGNAMLRIGSFRCFLFFMAFWAVTLPFCRFGECLWKLLHCKMCTFNTALVRHQSHLCTISHRFTRIKV